MGLTFKKRDDFGKWMDDLGVSTVDLVENEDEKLKNAKKEDPFAKFLTQSEDKTEHTPKETAQSDDSVKID